MWWLMWQGCRRRLAERALTVCVVPPLAAVFMHSAQCTAIPPVLSADVERIADPASSLPHMLPSDQQFAAAADALGISNEDALVVYDNTGGFGRAGRERCSSTDCGEGSGTNVCECLDPYCTAELDIAATCAC